MRIAHVAQAYSPVRGGAEWVAQQLSERLAARGHTVRVFTSTIQHGLGYSAPHVPHLPPGEDSVNGVPVTRFLVRFPLQNACRRLEPLCARLPLGPLGAICNAHARGPAMTGLAAGIAAWQPDLIVAIPAAASVFTYAVWARRRTGGRSALANIPCFHALDQLSNHPVVIGRMRSCDAVAVFTAQERDELVAQGVPRERVTVAGLGIDPVPVEGDQALGEEFRARHGLGRAPVIAFVGRKHRYKGVWFLVEAMQRVWRRLPEARLVVAGGRSAESEEMRRELGYLPASCQQHTLWIDDFEESEKDAIFAAADVVALPSLHESFGLVYLDAWLHGKPVIGCRLGSTASLVEEGVEGLLVTFEDKRELAAAILRLLAAPGLRQRMGEAGRRKLLREYTWETVIQRYEQAYQEAVARARRRQEGEA